MFDIIEGALGLVIPEEWSVLLKETHITMCFLAKLQKNDEESFPSLANFRV